MKNSQWFNFKIFSIQEFTSFINIIPMIIIIENLIFITIVILTFLFVASIINFVILFIINSQFFDNFLKR